MGFGRARKHCIELGVLLYVESEHGRIVASSLSPTPIEHDFWPNDKAEVQHLRT